MFNIKNIDEHLDSDEKVLKFFRPSRLAYIFQYISHGGIIIIAFIMLFFHKESLWLEILEWISIIFLAYSVISLVVLEYRIMSRRYALTTERLMYSRGIFSEKFRSSPYEKVTDIGFHQSLLDKILNTGTLSVNTAGTDNFEIRYRKVKNPHEIKKIINDGQSMKKAHSSKNKPN